MAPLENANRGAPTRIIESVSCALALVAGTLCLGACGSAAQSGSDDGSIPTLPGPPWHNDAGDNLALLIAPGSNYLCTGSGAISVTLHALSDDAQSFDGSIVGHVLKFGGSHEIVFINDSQLTLDGNTQHPYSEIITPDLTTGRWELSNALTGQLQITGIDPNAQTFVGLRRGEGQADRTANGSFDVSHPEQGIYSAKVQSLTFTAEVGEWSGVFRGASQIELSSAGRTLTLRRAGCE